MEDLRDGLYNGRGACPEHCIVGMFDEATTGGGGGGESNGSIGGNISVSIRFRPINSRELESGDQSACWNIIENSVQLSPHSMHRNCSNSSFSFGKGF